MQSVLEVAPVAVRYVPLPHKVHAVVCPSEKLPAAHKVEDVAPDAMLPVAYEPGGTAMQLANPVEGP